MARAAVDVAFDIQGAAGAAVEPFTSPARVPRAARAALLSPPLASG